MKLRKFLPIFLLFCCPWSRAAIDLPLDIVESHLKLEHGGELIMSIDGTHLSYAKLSYKGKVWILEGDVFAGIDTPDLSTVKVKLIGVNRCKVVNLCLDYVIPMIEVAVIGEIPEEKNCSGTCRVQFKLTDDLVIRMTAARIDGVMTYYDTKGYPFKSR
jgi:hypothetical protein